MSNCKGNIQQRSHYGRDKLSKFEGWNAMNVLIKEQERLMPTEVATIGEGFSKRFVAMAKTSTNIKKSQSNHADMRE